MEVLLESVVADDFLFLELPEDQGFPFSPDDIDCCLNRAEVFLVVAGVDQFLCGGCGGGGGVGVGWGGFCIGFHGFSLSIFLVVAFENVQMCCVDIKFF